MIVVFLKKALLSTTKDFRTDVIPKTMEKITILKFLKNNFRRNFGHFNGFTASHLENSCLSPSLKAYLFFKIGLFSTHFYLLWYARKYPGICLPSVSYFTYDVFEGHLIVLVGTGGIASLLFVCSVNTEFEDPLELMPPPLREDAGPQDEKLSQW